MHGTLMVFFVLTNAPLRFRNYFSRSIGAEDMAFPRLQYDVVLDDARRVLC